MVMLGQDKPLLLQQPQCFSKRSATNAELLCKLDLREHTPRRKRPVEDLPSQMLMHLSNDNPSLGCIDRLELHTRDLDGYEKRSYRNMYSLFEHTLCNIGFVFP